MQGGYSGKGLFFYFEQPSLLFPTGNYMFKVNNKDTKRYQWRRSGDFIVNFEHISHLALVFLLLILSR